ncbi:MAG: oxidoreductase domain protein [Bacilli bacterium]|nr:oxidoreductase domain protein [Bacilli bacterium]
METVNPIEFAIVGGGWRAEFFLRIARELPERFQVTGVVVRDEQKGRLLEEKWGIPTFRTVQLMLVSMSPSFVVVSVPRSVAPAIIRQMADRGMPVLSETPPAPDIDGLIELYKLVQQGAKLQVAEQYQFQPLHAARIAIASSGKLGQIAHAHVSVAHDYHGISLMRKLLGIHYQHAVITAQSFQSMLTDGPGRGGLPGEEKLKQSKHTIAVFNFQGKTGVYDFCGDQYRSWIRSNHLLVRGERGEINNDQLVYLEDYLTPIHIQLRRLNAGENGNLEGYYLKGIMAGSEWVYQNPFLPARLNDDEIAGATCLERMYQYVNGGPSFYSLAEAAQDHYLALMMDQAVTSGESIATTLPLWSE